MSGKNSISKTTRTDLPGLPEGLVSRAVNDAINEDLGLLGDITTMATVPEYAVANAAIVVREAGVVSGLDVARVAFKAFDGNVQFSQEALDGDSVSPGMTIAHVSGPARALLSRERVALNFLGRMSGIATLTRSYVDAVNGTSTRIVDTRKTTPNLRAFEKYAVRCGGGGNHRAGLFDAMMIKDNHIIAAGGLAAAVARARASAGHMVRIEVEVDTLSQLDDVLALADKVDAVLLDNMTNDDLARAVTMVSGRLVCEASGGVSMETVRAIAKTGVDIISVGALTHSARTLDVALDFAATAGA